MARTATLPMPQNTTHAAALAPPIPAGQTAQALPDWLMQQQQILRTAPDGDTAIRLLYAELLAERAMLLSENTRLQLALQAALVPPVAPARRVQRPPLRPQILALLRERGMPMTRPHLETALDLGPLAGALQEMVKAGLLTMVDGSYALPPERAPAPAAVPMPPAARTKRGKIRAPDAA